MEELAEPYTAKSRDWEMCGIFARRHEITMLFSLYWTIAYFVIWLLQIIDESAICCT